MKRARLFLLPLLLIAAAVPVAAQTATVRVLFYTGNVVTSAGTKPAIGQQLGAHDELTLAAGATLQLSINGKVIRYSQPAKVKVADAIRRAGNGENAAVATTVRTLAAASSSGSNRTSQAGATRVEGRSTAVDDAKRGAEQEVHNDADAEIKKYTGVDAGSERAETLADKYGNKNATLIPLEPRETAVSSAQLRFRWLHTSGVERYVVTVHDHVGTVLFRTETADTTITWDGSALTPDALYSWTLSDARDEKSGPEQMFHRLAADSARVLKAGTDAIRKELGADNPALPIVLAAFCADHGCHGEAARYFTQGALETPEHYDEFMQHARDEYADPIGLRSDELDAVYSVNPK